MKRVRKSAEIPDRLFLYAQLHPHDTWDKFHHRDRNGYKQVKQQLIKDQYGLCAYCEISIRLTDNEDLVDDFRVEHFHPKTGTENHEHNYHLDWNNMLGACHGGSHPYVEDAKYRYSASKKDRSCDVPKKAVNLWIHAFSIHWRSRGISACLSTTLFPEKCRWMKRNVRETAKTGQSDD